MVQPGSILSAQDSVWNGSAGPWPLISFGSEICGDPRLAAEREWLVTNGLGGYALGTVSGAPSRSYHGLLIAALAPPVERTLLVSQLQESVDGDPGACGPLQIVSFALEAACPAGASPGVRPCWRSGSGWPREPIPPLRATGWCAAARSNFA